MEESESKAVFLLHLHPSSQETFIQTLGKNELETSQRFSLSSETVSQIIQHENKTLKWDENINSEILAVFTEMFDDIHYRITVVPIVKKQNFYPCSIQNLKPTLLTCFLDSGKNEDYLINLAEELFKYCLPVLLNIMSSEEEIRKRIQYQSLLAVIRNLLLSVEDINGLIKTMTEEARKITNSKHCTLFLNNAGRVDLISKVFTTFSSSNIRASIKSAEDHIIPGLRTPSLKWSFFDEILGGHGNLKFLAPSTGHYDETIHKGRAIIDPFPVRS
ncbi:hypothetical protein Zmor_014623 [Zophobas morio]|uniref:Uncharacterized protein n=1 Tax=Zophobas morio TaxID=2755281 RepID=A0AA38IGG7_9CUCU|nr:hypothetical protein Zmor_014623 [Zophobas morio]